MTWAVIKGRDERMHVTPQHDLRPHRHHIDCWCHPMSDADDETVIIHNAMDERERYEQEGPMS